MKVLNLSVSIDKTLSILKSSLLAHAIEIKKEYKIINIISDEKTLNQVLLILLENAISILVERKIQNPTIYIKTDKKDGFSEIIVSDNAGGVDEKENK